MVEKVLEDSATIGSPAETSKDPMKLAVQLDGRTWGAIPLFRKVILAAVLTLALASSALGAFFLSGQAAGSGGNLKTSVTECPMGN